MPLGASGRLLGSLANTAMSRWLRLALAAALGIAIGLFYGWVVDPVEYIETTPASLREDYRVDYVLMVAEAFRAEGDAEMAARRLAILGSDPPASLASAAHEVARGMGFAESDLQQMQALAEALQAWQPVPGVNTP